MFIILSTLNQLNVEIRSPHRIHQLILSLDNILCPMCFKQQNIHLKLWFSLYGASPLEPKNSARTFLHFLLSQPQKKWLFWHHFMSHSPSPLPKLFPQNMHINSSTPQLPTSPLFPSILLWIYSIFPDFIRNCISQRPQSITTRDRGTKTYHNYNEKIPTHPNPIPKEQKFLNQGADFWTSSCLRSSNQHPSTEFINKSKEKPLELTWKGRSMALFPIWFTFGSDPP